MRFALILLMWAGCASAAQPRELIYGAQLMSAQERAAYRRSLTAAEKAPEQARIRAQHRERIRERARQRGVELAEPEGIVKPKGRP